MRKIIGYAALPEITAILFTVLFLAGTALAGDFSADFISNSSDPSDMPGKGKLYMKNGMMRMEMAGAVTIIRPDRGVMWILMEQEKMFMEHGAPAQSGRMQEWTPALADAAKKVGKETVSGFSCTKYELQQEGSKVLYWISDKISFPVKMQDPNGYMLLENIRLGGLSNGLFEVPAGYRKMEMPSMPGMPPGGMPQGMPSMPNMPNMPGGMQPSGQ